MLNAKPDPSTGELPPIQITVCEGTHDIVFRVSDKGGGIDLEMESHLWSYSQSPARFANFQKISRMAATVQGQLVSPCRSACVGEDDDGARDSAVEQRGQDLPLGGGRRSEDRGMERDLILPSPPVNSWQELLWRSRCCWIDIRLHGRSLLPSSLLRPQEVLLLRQLQPQRLNHHHSHCLRPPGLLKQLLILTRARSHKRRLDTWIRKQDKRLGDSRMRRCSWGSGCL